jgi:hypothetical protein
MPRTTLAFVVGAPEFTRRGEGRGALTVLPLGRHGDATPWLQTPEALTG